MLNKIKRHIFYMILIILSTISFTKTVFAKNISHLKLDSYTKQNSDENSIFSSNLYYASNRRNIFWPYSYSSNSDIDVGVQYKNNTGIFNKEEIVGSSFSLFAGKKIHQNYYIKFSPTFHTYSYINNKYKILNYNTSLMYRDNTNQLAIYYKSDFEYESLQFYSKKDIALKSKSIEAIYKLKNNLLNYSLTSLIKKYNDKNTTSKTTLEVYYNHIFLNTEFTIGISSKYERSKLKDTTYSAPYSSLSFGPQFGLYKNIFKDITISSSASIERTNDSNIDFWGDLSVSFFDRNTHNLKLSYERSSSFSDEKWNENKFKININLFM